MGKVRLVSSAKSNKECYEVVKEWILEDRLYQLVRCSLPDANRRTRRKVLSELLERRATIGLIEWWIRGSIARKPWREFYVIVIEDSSEN